MPCTSKWKILGILTCFGNKTLVYEDQDNGMLFFSLYMYWIFWNNSQVSMIICIYIYIIYVVFVIIITVAFLYIISLSWDSSDHV